jgi:dehydrogenase/reductase SDR family protein 12
VHAQINERKLSVDGFEINFATNTLGTFALTHQLLPCLRRSGPGARIVTVTSGGAYTAPLVVDDLQYEKGTLTGIAQYARDKRRQIAMMERFAEKLVDSKIGCYLMHPGWVETAGVRNAMPEFHKSFSSMFRTVEQGADTVLWLALMDADRLQSGGLYLDRNVQHKHMFMAGTEYTEADVDALWAKLLDMSSLGAREKGTGEGAVGIGRSDDHVTVNGVSGVEQSTRKSGNVNDTA